mgnify:FL=1
MALKHVIYLTNITDAKVTPSGGTSKDVEGIAEVKVSADVVNAEAKGDCVIKSYYSKTLKSKLEFNHAVLSLDVLGALLGETVADAGSTPSQTATLSVKSTSHPYFKFEGRTTDIVDEVGLGLSPTDAHIIIYKCKIDSWNIEFKDNDYWQVSFTATAIPDPNNSDKIMDIKLYETLTSIT